MIKKVGSALKTAAQRLMWRGDRQGAEAIHNFGMYGMRDNLMTHSATKITPINHTGKTVTQSKNAAAAIGEMKVSEQMKNMSNQPAKKTGASIMDLLQ